MKQRAQYEAEGSVVLLKVEIRTIWADHAAKGLLFSGASAKWAIKSAEVIGAVLIDTSIQKLELACRGAWVSRTQLKRIVRSEASDGIGRLAETVLDAIKGLNIDGAALPESERMLETARGRLMRKLDDHFAGWTPTALGWFQRHGFWKWAIGGVGVIMLAVIGDAISKALGFSG